MTETTLQTLSTVKNRKGLHARPCTLIVEAALQFQAEIYVIRGNRRANAKKVLDLLCLGAEQGTSLALEVSGPDADQALAAIKTLIETQFLFD